MEEALKTAKERVGGNAGLANAILEETGERISPQAVSQWSIVPATRVLAVEKVTGVSRHLLRPDIYGTEPSAPSAQAAEAQA